MQSSNTPDEILGNASAPHVLKFEYCGGWGYRRYVVAAIDQIEKVPEYKGQFKYALYMDPGVTGRLEVTLYKNSHDDQSADGIVLHSKVATKQYIHTNYD